LENQFSCTSWDFGKPIFLHKLGFWKTNFPAQARIFGKPIFLHKLGFLENQFSFRPAIKGKVKQTSTTEIESDLPELSILANIIAAKKFCP